jgi:hypothetical protein
MKCKVEGKLKNKSHNTLKPVLCDLPKGTVYYGHLRQVITKYRFMVINI